MMKHKRVLITGGSGFIGTALARKLQSEQAQIFNISLKSKCPVAGVENYQLNLADQVLLDSLIKNISPEIVFHLAAHKHRNASLETLQQTITTNFIGSLNLYVALKKYAPNLQQIVALGTGEEYGNSHTPFDSKNRENPVSPYSLSKVCQTHLSQLMHKLHGIPITCLRPALAYGPGQNDDMFIPSLIRQLKNKQTFAMSAGEQTREFIYIDDLINAILQAAKKPKAIGEILNVGHGPAVKLKDLALMVARILGQEQLLSIGTHPYRPLEIMNYNMNCQATFELLEWQPHFNLQAGIEKTIEYFQG